MNPHRQRILVVACLLSLLFIGVASPAAAQGGNASGESDGEPGDLQETQVFSLPRIDLSLGLEGTLSGVVRMTVSDEASAPLILVLPPQSTISSVIDGGGASLGYRVEEAADETRLFIGEGAQLADSYVVSFVNPYLTGKQGDVWTFSYQSSATPFETVLYVNVPSNLRITRPFSREILWSPRTSNGFILYPRTDPFHFSMEYDFSGSGQPAPPRPGGENATTSTLATPSSSGGDERFYLLVILVLVVVVSLLVASLYRSSPTAAGASVDEREAVVPTEAKRGGLVKDSVLKVLNDNERKVLRLIEDSYEEITQAYIYKETKIPKTTLSDILKNLESRNVIERRKEGRLNWIKLKDWVLE